jgi:hypothetical protein
MDFYTEVAGLNFVNVFLMEYVTSFPQYVSAVLRYLSLHSDNSLFLPFSPLASKQQAYTDTLLVSNGGGKHRIFKKMIHAF